MIINLVKKASIPIKDKLTHTLEAIIELGGLMYSVNSYKG